MQLFTSPIAWFYCKSLHWVNFLASACSSGFLEFIVMGFSGVNWITDNRCTVAIIDWMHAFKHKINISLFYGSGTSVMKKQ